MQALNSDLRTPSYCMIRVVIGTAFKPNASLYSVFFEGWPLTRSSITLTIVLQTAWSQHNGCCWIDYYFWPCDKRNGQPFVGPEAVRLGLICIWVGLCTSLYVHSVYRIVLLVSCLLLLHVVVYFLRCHAKLLSGKDVSKVTCFKKIAAGSALPACVRACVRVCVCDWLCVAGV